MIRIRTTRCRVRAASLLIVSLGWAGTVAGAQPAPPPSLDAAAIKLAATENTLWLIRAQKDSEVLRRTVTEREFVAVGELFAPIAQTVATREALYAFTETGAFYSLWRDRSVSEANLPGRALPVSVDALTAELYALIRSPSPDVLGQIDATTEPTETQPFDPGDAALSVARYANRRWMALAPAPPALTADGPARLGPRIGMIGETVWLFWPETDSMRVHSARLNPLSRTWDAGPKTEKCTDLRAFWMTTVNRVPTLITASTEGGVETLKAWRLLGERTPIEATWHAATLELSELPPEVKIRRYESASGFNQHVALLMVDQNGAFHIQFAGVDREPAEPTISVAGVFKQRARNVLRHGWLQMVILVVLFGILILLFTLRRGALAQALVLPPGCAPALTIQRLLSLAVDLAPFVLLSATVIDDVDLRRGLQQLGTWAAGSNGGQLPPNEILLWWFFGTAAHAVYATTMELLTGRTVGKVLFGLRVLSESGTPAAPGRILLRNALRFLELQPPLWVLGFLVILSRNRQRTGDIFARTIVARRAPPAATKQRQDNE